MISVETRIEIGRPAPDVFAFVSDQTNAPRWQSGLDEVYRLTPGPIRVGSEHRFIRRFAGRRIESQNKFVVFEPSRFVAFDIAPGGGVTGEASYLVEPISASTCALTSRVQLRFLGLGRLVEPILGRVLRRDVERDDQVLKALLEAEGSSGPGRGHVDRDRPVDLTS